jgi:hypothetical protein
MSSIPEPTHATKKAPEIVAQAFELADANWTPAQIVKILAGRGHSVSVATVCRWLDPKQAEKDRVLNRRIAARRRDELRAQRSDDPYPGLTGLSRKVRLLEDRIERLESVESDGHS